MILRCRHCSGRLGLGLKSQRVWQREAWSLTTYRFCSVKCEEAFDRAKRDATERRRTIRSLFHSSSN